MQTYIRLLCCIEMLTFGKRLLGMPMNLAVLSLEGELDKPKEFTAQGLRMVAA